jgi:hypothetical protein
MLVEKEGVWCSLVGLLVGKESKGWNRHQSNFLDESQDAQGSQLEKEYSEVVNLQNREEKQ